MRIQGSAADLQLAGLDSPPAGDVVVALGDGGAGADVRFPPDGPPWPVRDALFDLAPAAADAGVLAVGSAEVADALARLGRTVVSADRLTVPALEAAAVVVMASPSGSLPVHAMAVLAARRVLVTGPVETTFGLFPGIEFLHAAAVDEAVELAMTALLHPEAMVTLRVLGAVAAERHRASRVYSRLTALP
jgi:hypothetical protein